MKLAAIAIFLSLGLNAMQNTGADDLIAKIQTACRIIAPAAKNLAITPLSEGGSGHRKKFTCVLDDKKYLACVLDAPYVNRRQEVEAHRLAITFGYAPQLQFCSDDYTLIIMDFIPGRTLRLHDCPSEHVIHQVAALSKRLAAQQASFSDNKSFAAIYECGERLLAQKTPLSRLIATALEKAKQLEERIGAQHRQPVLCHHDLHPRNMFFTNGHLTVIDWEEAGLDLEFFDLAYFSVSACLNTPADLELLTSYLGTAPSAQDQDYFVQLKLAIQVFDALRLFAFIRPTELIELSSRPQVPIHDYTHYETIFIEAEHDPFADPTYVYELGYSELSEFLKNVDAAL